MVRRIQVQKASSCTGSSESLVCNYRASNRSLLRRLARPVPSPLPGKYTSSTKLISAQTPPPSNELLHASTNQPETRRLLGRQLCSPLPVTTQRTSSPDLISREVIANGLNDILNQGGRLISTSARNGLDRARASYHWQRLIGRSPIQPKPITLNQELSTTPVLGRRWLSNAATQHSRQVAETVIVQPLDFGTPPEKHKVNRRKLNRHRNLTLNRPHGDIQPSRKPANTVRLCALNPNGLRLPDKCSNTFLHMQTMEVDVVNISEHNLDTSNPTATQIFFQAIQGTSKDFQVQFASSILKARKEFKPGGTMTILRDDVASRSHLKLADSYGRWSCICTDHSTGGHPIAFISAYQPCRGPPKEGSMTFITQLYLQLLEEKREQPQKVRKHFVEDLRRFIRDLQRQGYLIVLSGDFNEVIGPKRRRGMSKLCQDLGLVDVIHRLHGKPKGQFASYVGGKDILDYVLINGALLPAVRACGYAPFNTRDHGDHRAMFVDFDETRLFGADQAASHHYLEHMRARYGYRMSRSFFGGWKHLSLTDSEAQTSSQ